MNIAHEASSARSPDANGKRRLLLLARILAPATFLWVFFCGVGWIDSGARHDGSPFMTNLAWGFLAAAPGFIAALVIFCGVIHRLIRGKRAPADALFFSLGAILGGLLMDLMVFQIFIDRTYPTVYSHGRRLHHRAKILAPGSAAGASWIGEVTAIDVPSSQREGLAAQWRENGSKEHASIAAFSHLTLDLLALGAPARLVAAAQAASLDEVRHAEACYGVARAIDGCALSPAPFPDAYTRRTLSRTRSVALAEVAVDALADGALNEGIAARLLARLAKRASDPSLARLLAKMAADEARHAKDSWDVIEWCLAEGGDVVRLALHRAKETMPETLGSPLPVAARDGGWEAWGVQGTDLEKTEYVIVRRHAAHRIDTLLARVAA